MCNDAPGSNGGGVLSASSACTPSLGEPTAEREKEEEQTMACRSPRIDVEGERKLVSTDSCNTEKSLPQSPVAQMAETGRRDVKQGFGQAYDRPMQKQARSLMFWPKRCLSMPSQPRTVHAYFCSRCRAVTTPSAQGPRITSNQGKRRGGKRKEIAWSRTSPPPGKRKEKQAMDD